MGDSGLMRVALTRKCPNAFGEVSRDRNSRHKTTSTKPPASETKTAVKTRGGGNEWI